MPKIVLYPKKILRKKSEKVVSLDAKTKNEIKGLSKYLSESDDGAGLAANQIGIAKRFFGVKNRQTKKVTIYINPKIEKKYGNKQFFSIEIDDADEDFLEGCLSFPGFFGTVKRWGRVDVSWQEIEKDKLVKKNATFDGFEAIVMQHETNHLDGILFVDYVKKDAGKFYKVVSGEMLSWDIDEVLKKEKKN